MSFPIPSKQKALVLPEAHGQFVVQEVDVLQPRAGAVLVRADAVGLNPVDWIIQKTNRFSPQYPLVLGWEAAGTVVQVGEGVTSLVIGDKVYVTFFLQSAAVALDFVLKNLYRPVDFSLAPSGNTTPLSRNTSSRLQICAEG